MPMTDIPILSMLRTRMHWHQDRQRLLAENVANSDTPNFRPRELKELKFDGTAAPGALKLATTNGAHVGTVAGRPVPDDAGQSHRDPPGR